MIITNIFLMINMMTKNNILARLKTNKIFRKQNK